MTRKFNLPSFRNRDRRRPRWRCGLDKETSSAKWRSITEKLTCVRRIRINWVLFDCSNHVKWKVDECTLWSEAGELLRIHKAFQLWSISRNWTHQEILIFCGGRGAKDVPDQHYIFNGRQLHRSKLGWICWFTVKHVTTSQIHIQDQTPGTRICNFLRSRRISVRCFRSW